MPSPADHFTPKHIRSIASDEVIRDMAGSNEVTAAYTESQWKRLCGRIRTKIRTALMVRQLEEPPSHSEITALLRQALSELHIIPSSPKETSVETPDRQKRLWEDE